MADLKRYLTTVVAPLVFVAGCATQRGQIDNLNGQTLVPEGAQEEVISPGDQAALDQVLQGLNGVAVVTPADDTRLEITITNPDGGKVEVKAPGTSTCIVTSPSSVATEDKIAKSAQVTGGSVTCVSANTVEKVTAMVNELFLKSGLQLPAPAVAASPEAGKTTIAIPGKGPASLPAADEYFLPGVLGR